VFLVPNYFQLLLLKRQHGSGATLGTGRATYTKSPLATRRKIRRKIGSSKVVLLAIGKHGRVIGHWGLVLLAWFPKHS